MTSDQEQLFPVSEEQLREFEEAFGTGSSGCRRTCECGVVFFNDDTGWSWEDGELEELQADPASRALDYPPGEVSFEGHGFVNACSCWHPRARQLIRFFNTHARGIAGYLRLEKRRKEREAANSPVVEDEAGKGS